MDWLVKEVAGRVYYGDGNGNGKGDGAGEGEEVEEDDAQGVRVEKGDVGWEKAVDGSRVEEKELRDGERMTKAAESKATPTTTSSSTAESSGSLPATYRSLVNGSSIPTQQSFTPSPTTQTSNPSLRSNPVQSTSAPKPTQPTPSASTSIPTPSKQRYPPPHRLAERGSSRKLVIGDWVIESVKKPILSSKELDK